jgi:hypothetical protein
LAEQDEQRRNEQRNSPFPSLWNAPKFDSPVEQRRLRIINAMFNAFERCGMKPSISKEARELGVCVGEQFVGFTLDAVAARRARSVAPAKEREAAAQLTLVIGGSRGAPDGRLSWADQPGLKIENRITEIVIELIVTGEKRHRANAQAHYEWIVERKAAMEDERRRAQEEAERRERERQQRLEQARIDRLLEEAGALRKAQEIRAYVQTVCETNPSLHQPLSHAELEAWTSWALAHADRIDPIRSGRFRAPRSERDE